MIACFADTSYFVAILSPGDVNHTKAQKITTRLRRRVVTSEYVIVEVGSFFWAPSSRGRLGSFMSVIESDPNTVIVPASSALLRNAIGLFASRDDKSWSLTD